MLIQDVLAYIDHTQIVKIKTIFASRDNHNTLPTKAGSIFFRQSVLETLSRHRSICKFKNDAIDDQLLRTLLESAINGSSSSGNLNSFSIIKTTNADRKRALYELYSHQDFILEAPLLLAFCADQYRTRGWLQTSKAKYSPEYQNESSQKILDLLHSKELLVSELIN